MKHYKVMTMKDKLMGGKFDPDKLETALNEYAKQGWKLISAFSSSINTVLGKDRDEAIMILEKDE